jgi:predicted ATPase/DNA-binding CsgD family transcriptional regulator
MTEDILARVGPRHLRDGPGSDPGSFATIVSVDRGVTKREAEVWALLGEPLTYAEIGERLFISARTVESHVIALRRKLDVADRRELARLHAERTAPLLALPAALSSFIGRERDRERLAEALTEARLVSVIGPGGMGKTRLALRVAADVRARFPAGVWYVDLVPSADAGDVLGAVLEAMACEPQLGRSGIASLAARIGQGRALLVLDNAEHVLDPAARLAEDLLSRCAELRVLVTSRSRLVLPFEHVYELTGLRSEDEGPALFRERAGTPDADLERVGGICERLGGLALAIELAAVRSRTLGLDGVEAALAHPDTLLVGGPRLASRHRSMEDVLRWSYGLLDTESQLVFRRVSVFVSAFDVAAATAVTGELPEPLVADLLGRLCDHSLLQAIPGPGGTRYRALEPVRALAARMLDSEEADALGRAHTAWARATLELLSAEDDATDAWCRRVDERVDDLRAALAREIAGRRAAHELADALARVLFTRGRLRDAQAVAERGASGCGALFATAAAIAKCRVAGNDAVRLEQEAAAAYLTAGEPVNAAVALARAVEMGSRWSGMSADPMPTTTSEALLERARTLAGGDTHALTTIKVAMAHDRRSGRVDDAQASVVAARDHSDPVLLSSCLDALTVAQLVADGAVAAAATAVSRIDALRRHTYDPAVGLELKDAYHTAAMMLLGAGDVNSSLNCARKHRDLPFLRAERDLAAEELFAPAALSGDWDDALAAADGYRQAWEHSGAPAAPGRAIAPAAAALIFGLRGEDQAAAEWRHVHAAMRGPTAAIQAPGYIRVFDAVLALDRQRPTEALATLGTAGNEFYDVLFAPWHAALAAEAAVLASNTRAEELLRHAHSICRPDSMPGLIARRALSLRWHGRSDQATADAFAAAGAPYQEARSRSLTIHPSNPRDGR